MRDLHQALLQTLVLALFLFTTSCQRVIVTETKIAATPAIIGGETASANEFPFIVNIWQNSPQDSFVDHLCGGSLIHEKWVLTAAHCLLEDVTDTSQGTVPVKELTLYIGSDKISGEGGRKLTAKAIHIHPQFIWPKYDVALIELNETVTQVPAVRLNHKDLGATNTSLRATAAGWGLIDAEGRNSSDILRKVSVPLISREECNQDAYVKKFNWHIGPEILCASSSNDTKSACAGDSGGPLVLTQDKSVLLIGIVSWGAACRGKNPARSQVEGYADVAQALPWIQNIVGDDL